MQHYYEPIVTYKDEHLEASIEHDSAVGYYLFVIKDGIGQGDWLQDDLDMAMRCARRLFQIPLDAWKKVS